MVYHHHREIPRDLVKNLTDGDIPARKKVRFSEIDIKFHPKKGLRRILPRSKTREYHLQLPVCYAVWIVDILLTYSLILTRFKLQSKGRI